MQSSITKVYQDVIMRMLNYFSQVLLAFVFGTTVKTYTIDVYSYAINAPLTHEGCTVQQNAFQLYNGSFFR